MTLRFPHLRGVLLGGLALGLLGCGDGERNPGVDGGGETGPGPLPRACLSPTEGCPCTSDKAVKCGETVSRKGEIVTCRVGERSCVGGVWGECVGTETSEIYAAPRLSPGVHPQDLATSSASCMEVCEPYCQELADTPDGVTVGTGLDVDPGGITLHNDGFTGGNCPDLDVTPDAVTLEITQINPDGTVVPDTVTLDATCGVNATPVTPSWSHDQPDRAVISDDGALRVFSGVASEIAVTGASLLDSDISMVSVIVNINELGTGATAADQTLFGGAGTGADPGKTLYPYHDTVFPLDLKAPLVQWQTGGTTATQVQVALRFPAGAASPTFWYSKIYNSEPMEGTLQATGAPAWQVPQEIWSAFDRTASGDAGEIIIQRRNGGTLYQEMIIPITFADESLRGTVYYTQYKRKLFDSVATFCSGTQTALNPATYNPLNPGGFVCGAGNCTHVDESGASTTRSIDMSTPNATNNDPFGANPGGCPVCHSLSANGNKYVAGSRFLQKFPDTTYRPGFVNNITLNPSGVATFTLVGEAPNYAQLPTATDWDSRGFSYAPLTPDGALALQGFYSWGNTGDGTVANNLVVSRAHTSGGQNTPMFFVPTDNTGASVQYATTAALTATRTGNVLTASAVGVIPTIDGATMSLNNSVLVKNQGQSVDNGIYTVTDLGTAAATSTDLTTSTTLTVTTSSTPLQSGANAFDNNTGSRWESPQGAGTQWIQVDLGSSKTINGVTIMWEAANARDYTIQGSTDNVTWTVLSTQTGLGGPVARTDTLTFANTTQRYVRVNCTLRNNTFGYSAWEINVFGVSAGTPYKLTRRVDADDAPGTANVVNMPSSGDDYGTIKANHEVRVTRGTANYGHVFRLTSPTSAPTINTSALTFTDINSTAITWPMATPTISPDGTKLAYVTGDTDVIGADSTAWRKGLTLADVNQGARTVTNKKRILNNWNATTGGNPLKWPFFEGDSRSLIFMESTEANFCSTEVSTSDDGRGCKESVYGNFAPTTRGRWPGLLYSIDTAAGTPSTTKAELAKLNDAENTADADKAYQPTVLPISIGGYRWVIFTSPRSYGNQINQIGTHFTCGATMLWVSALDDATATATDRSHPAFFLPGQNVLPITTEKHYVNERGYLVKSPCKPNGLSCSTSDECCTMNCAVDTVPATGPPTKICKDPAACSAVGGACLTDDDCCGDSPCVNQECVNVPTYMGPAIFERDYEAECPAGFHPLWGLFSYHVTTPTDSHIELDAQTAKTLMDLDTASLVDVGDTTADNYGQTLESVDVGDGLFSADVSPNLTFLRIRMTLHPSADGSFAPTIHDWEQRYTCVPAE